MTMKRLLCTWGGKCKWKGYVNEDKKDNAWGKYEDKGYSIYRKWKLKWQRVGYVLG